MLRYEESYDGLVWGETKEQTIENLVSYSPWLRITLFSNGNPLALNLAAWKVTSAGAIVLILTDDTDLENFRVGDPVVQDEATDTITTVDVYQSSETPPTIVGQDWELSGKTLLGTKNLGDSTPIDGRLYNIWIYDYKTPVPSGTAIYPNVDVGANTFTVFHNLLTVLIGRLLVLK